MRSNSGKFRTPYTRKLIIRYLRTISEQIGRSPTYRDLKTIPGPSPRTVVRHFGKWSNTLKASGLRPQTNQLIKGEKAFIQKNWSKFTDKQISEKLGISTDVIKYYRMQYKLWKNRKGASGQKHKSDGMQLYGKNCEICNIPITELHHIAPKSTDPKNWAILCPTCHSVITRKLVKIQNRDELKTKLTPYIKNLHKNNRFIGVEAGDNDNASI